MRQRSAACGQRRRPRADALRPEASLDGPTRLAAFAELPDVMQAGAWLGLRREIERQRELDEGGEQ